MEISPRTGWKVLSTNPMLGTTTWMREVGTDGSWEQVTLQDPSAHEALMDFNHVVATAGRNGYSPTRDFQQVGGLSKEAIIDMQKRHGVDAYNPEHMADEKHGVMRLLRDLDYSKLRTSSGNI